MVVHDDLATGLCVDTFAGWLLEQMPSGAKCEKTFWLSNLLRAPVLQEQAALEASRADVILVSIGRKKELPGGTREWLRRWLNHAKKQPYLLGLIHLAEWGDEGPGDEVFNYVREIATAAGAEFFCWNAETECRFADLADPVFSFIHSKIRPAEGRLKIPARTPR
jgi:hypothetical protein